MLTFRGGRDIMMAQEAFEMTIGDRIRIKRLELGLSQDDLAIKLGYKSRSSINKIENNAQNLRQSKIKAIADALNTTPGEIMGWDDEEEKPQEETLELSEEEEQLILFFRSVPEEHRQMILAMIRTAIESLE
jgi:transcriptional regulator with XRE-family HTH domain